MILALRRCYLGAGRATKEDEIDLSVGIVLKKKIGDAVQKVNQLQLFIRILKMLKQSVTLLQEHIIIGDEAVEPPQLIGEIITN